MQPRHSIDCYHTDALEYTMRVKVGVYSCDGLIAAATTTRQLVSGDDNDDIARAIVVIKVIKVLLSRDDKVSTRLEHAY